MSSILPRFTPQIFDSSSSQARRAVTDPRQASSDRLVWAASIFLYLGVSLPIGFFRLGTFDVATMEGIVADGARHMASTQQFSVPHLHGEIYSYKPPLVYWMALASFRLFGEETEWTLRFPFALAGVLLGMAVLLLVGQIVEPRSGLLCALASITGILTIQKLHLAEFDTPLMAGVGVAIVVACRNLACVRPRGALWLIGYLGLAAGFLAKGMPALMFYVPGLLAAAWVTRRSRALLDPWHLAGVFLFLLVVWGWIYSAFHAVGWEAFEQPLAEARDKGFSWSYRLLAATLLKPGVVWALFLPWTLSVAIVVRRQWWESLDDRARRTAAAALAFVVLGILMFMIVPTTQSRYFLPLSTPLGILCGLAAGSIDGSWRNHRHLRRGAKALGLTAVLGTGAIALWPQAEIDLTGRLVLAGVAGVTAVFVVLGLARPRRFHAVGWLLAAALCHGLVHTLYVEPHRARSRSLRPVAASFKAHVPSGAAMWTAPVSRHFRHSSLFFYLGLPVKTYSRHGEGPAPGDLLVLFSDELPESELAPPLDFTVVDRREQRLYEFVLARVLPTRPAKLSDLTSKPKDGQ